MPEVGDNLGRYTLLKRLAVGGMGEVFLAAKAGPVGFGPYVALKVLRSELATDQQFVDMIVDEANISMFLNHQNVVSVLDLSEDNGQYYLAMEYVRGLTVERLVDGIARSNRAPDVPVGLYIATELCRALKYAHTRVNHAGEPLNIIHRDVTPANILLSYQGEVKLTDFGIARARGRIHQTQAGVLKGKFGYMAPEMVRYEQIDARADLFCAGVVIYLMISGKHPVAGTSIMEAIQNFEDKKIPPPSSLNDKIPKTLDEIVLRALEPKVENRWASAAELGDALQDVVLKNPAWRREVQDGAKSIASLIKEIAPEVLEEPITKEARASLLEKARDSSFSAPAGLAASKSPAGPPVADVDDLQISTTPEPAAPARIPNIADVPTATGLEVATGAGASLPAVGVSDPNVPGAVEITPDMNFAPTPTVGADEETDEALKLEMIRAARSELAEEAEEFTPSESTLDTEQETTPEKREALIPISSGNGANIDVLFPDSSTDRNRIREDMMLEPQLPTGGSITDGGSVADFDDGATLATYSSDAFDGDSTVAEEGGSDFGDDATVVGYDEDRSGVPTLAVPAVDPALRAASYTEDGNTVAGMAAPDWDEYDLNKLRQPSVIEDDEMELATIIPSQGNELASVEWGDETEAAGGDATLLDGIDVQQLQEAKAAASVVVSSSPPSPSAPTYLPSSDPFAPEPRAADPHDEEGLLQTLEGDEVRKLTAAVDGAMASAPVSPATQNQPVERPMSLNMDAIVADSLESGSRSPPLLDGPLKIVTGDGPPELAGHQGVKTGAMEAKEPGVSKSAEQLLASAAGPKARPPAQEKAAAISEQPVVGAPVATPGLDMGPATGRWIKGEIDAGALDWSDEAAARRAVAARDAVPGAEPATPSNPAFAHGSHQPPGPPNFPPGPAMPAPVLAQPRQASAGFWARNWLVVITLGVAMSLIGGLAYAYMYTQIFWPRLKLDSSPQGALVKVDGVQVGGRTPVVVRVQPDKRHEIEFDLKGHKHSYHPLTKQIKRGKTYRLTVSLERLAPKLHMPVKGTVTVNGQPAGSGQMVELDKLPPGALTIRIEAKGYKPYELKFGSRDEVPPSLDIPLSKIQ